jgi:hypothetical protein
MYWDLSKQRLMEQMRDTALEPSTKSDKCSNNVSKSLLIVDLVVQTRPT